MIGVLIVDDEQPARAVLREMLSCEPDLRILGECATGFEAVKMAAELRPGAIFLDIEMPKLDGFEVLELLDPAIAVVFVTAYDSYALRAFEVHAVDYVLKPFRAERLREALARARERVGHRPEPAILAHSARPPGDYARRIVVKDGARIHLIPVDRLDSAQAQDDYVELRSDGKAISDADARELEPASIPPPSSASTARPGTAPTNTRDRAVREEQPCRHSRRRHACARQPRRACADQGAAGGERRSLAELGLRNPEPRRRAIAAAQVQHHGDRRRRARTPQLGTRAQRRGQGAPLDGFEAEPREEPLGARSEQPDAPRPALPRQGESGVDESLAEPLPAAAGATASERRTPSPYSSSADRADHGAAVPSHERRGEMIDDAAVVRYRPLEMRKERDKVSFRRGVSVSLTFSLPFTRRPTHRDARPTRRNRCTAAWALFVRAQHRLGDCATASSPSVDIRRESVFVGRARSFQNVPGRSAVNCMATRDLALLNPYFPGTRSGSVLHARWQRTAVNAGREKGHLVRRLGEGQCFVIREHAA